MKKLICVVAALVLLMSLSLTAAAESEQYTIGIAQFAEHGSLDNCREGFLMGHGRGRHRGGRKPDHRLSERPGGYGHRQSDRPAICLQQCGSHVRHRHPGGPRPCYNAAEGNIPTIYTAVTDPVAAMLAGEGGSPVGNATGHQRQAAGGKSAQGHSRHHARRPRRSVFCTPPARSTPKAPSRNIRPCPGVRL